MYDFWLLLSVRVLYMLVFTPSASRTSAHSCHLFVSPIQFSLVSLTISSILVPRTVGLGSELWAYTIASVRDMVMDLPGYRYEETTGKYFKMKPGEVARPPPSASSLSLSSTTTSKKSRKAGGVATSITPRQIAAQQHPFRRVFERHWNASSTCNQCVLSLECICDAWLTLHGISSDLEVLALGKYKLLKRIVPDCLPLDESITCLTFESGEESMIRIGGSLGSIALVGR